MPQLFRMMALPSVLAIWFAGNIEAVQKRKRPESASEPASRASEFVVTAEDRRHWAFRSLEEVMPPSVNAAGRAQTPPDRFILAKLHRAGLTMAPPAAPRQLIRRIYFDLHGLPPSPEEVDRWTKRFGSSSGADAVSELIDELLASPHYGERWARHWLDVARYADSAGYERDADRPNAHAYRDFVIRALNEDLAFDVFVRWQIAGDELAPENPDAMAATGFCAIGPELTYAPTETDLNKRKARYDVLDDIISTTGSAMLGLTIGCARCHDHKYDAIPTRDYYRLTAAFVPNIRIEASLSKPHRDLELWVADQKEFFRNQKIDALADATGDEKAWLREPPNAPAESKAAYRKFGDRLEFTEDEWLRWLGPEKREELSALRRSVELSERSGRSALPPAMMIGDSGADAPQAWLYDRGDVSNPVEPVSFGFLQILAGKTTPEAYRRRARSAASLPAISTYQRAALAEWLIDVEEGAGALLARVIVNRLWQHHFGTGLVRTPNDFGVRGDEPTHPKLLDWLAGELIRNGWRLKPMHRVIMNSAVYQQSSVTSPAMTDMAVKVDPENELLWRRRPVRLEAEAFRDAILTVSGQLNRTLYGPPIRVPIPESAMATRSRDAYPVVEESRDQWRRSIYLFVKRSVRTPMMEIFDAPDPTASCGARISTTVPTQALMLMNDTFVRGQARHFASRVAREADDSDDNRIRRAYEIAFARPPAEDDLARSREFLRGSNDRHEALTDLCHVLLSVNEFIYID